MFRGQRDGEPRPSDDLLGEGESPSSLPWLLPTTFHTPRPRHRPSEVSHLLPMPERGCAAPRLPGPTPVPLLPPPFPHWQDSNARAPAEVALSNVGMNLAVFWPILDSILQLVSFRQKITSEWRTERHLRQRQFTISLPKRLCIWLALEVAWTYFSLEVKVFNARL